MKHLKLFFALFAMLALGVGNAWGAEETLECPAGTISNNTMTWNLNSCTIVHAKGSNNNYVANSPWRVYQGAIVTFTPKSNTTIDKIVITVSEAKYATPGASTWTNATAQASGSTITVTPTDGTKEISITASAQTRWSKIVITYTSGGTTPPPPAKTYTIKWHTAKGVTTDVTLNEGATITKPATDPTMTGYVFMGWTEDCDVASDGADFTAISDFGTAKEDKDYYAVFAKATTTGGGSTTTEVTDVLNRAITGVTSTNYDTWSGKTATSSAVYAGQSAGGNSSIQLRTNNSNSGIVTTASGGKAKKVSVVWNSNTSSGRTIDIYGKNSAYAQATDLYSTSTQGTKLGSIKYGTSTELAISGDYEYIGIRSNSGALYLTSVSITWASEGTSGGTTTYSDYITTCASGIEYVELGDAFKWSAASAEVTIDATDNVFPTLTNTHSVPVTYSSSDDATASIATDGTVTLKKEGTVTITAKYEGGTSAGTGKEYKAKTVDYTLIVKPAPLEPIAGGVIDILDNAWTELTNSDYKTVDAKTAANTGHSNAQYTAQCAGSNSSIQLRSNNSNSGIVSTVSGGLVKRVEIEWNDETSAGSTLNIYGSNTPYTNPTDLYDTYKDGDKLGTIVKGTSTHLEISEDYRYIGLRSASGAMYLTKVTITWLPINSKVSIDDAIQHGSISVSGATDLNAVAAGTELTLDNNPTTGYKLAAYDVYKTDDATTKVTVTDGKFIMPEFDVTISATFEATKTLNSIEITTSATQTTFWQGETFNYEGLKVIAHFDGAADEDVTDKVTVTGSTATAGAAVEVTVSFTEGTTTKTATYTITVKATANTTETAYDVATAREIIDKVSAANNIYVKGIVSKIVTAYDPTYGNITYNISADGLETSAQLQAFRGKSFNGDSFTSTDDIKVGDEVVVFGNLLKFNSTYELDANNKLISLNRNKAVAGLAYETTEYTAKVNEVFSTPTLTNPNGLTVTYSSNDETLATVNATTGDVTILDKAGKVTITATFGGDAAYLPGTASYNITITDPNQLEATFVAADDKGNTTQGEGEIIKSPITFACSDGILGNGEEYRIYANAKAIFSAAEGYIITKVVLTSTASDDSKYGPAKLSTEDGTYTYSGKEGTWVGEAYTVTLTASAQTRATLITVYYKQDNRVDAGLAWSSATVSLTVGDAFTAPTFSNPNSLAVSFESSNTELATVDNAGVISLVSGKKGSATITATFAGDATYKAAEVTCVITVNPKSEKVVILAEYNGQWYALKNVEQTAGKVIAALPVNYVGGKLYNVADADKATIEWQLAIDGTIATFKNGENYISGTAGSADMKLATTECEWTYDGSSYMIGNRTFLYRAQANGFKNYNAEDNAGTADYSSLPVVTAPVYATGDAYGRTVTEGDYGTLCIPYGSSNYTGAEFYEVSWLEVNKGLWLNEVNGTLEAGKPYIFRATASEIAILGDGNTAIAPQTGANGLTGTFIDIAADGILVDNYIIAENNIWIAGTGATLPANRAYISATLVPTTEQAKIPGRRRVCMGENAATGFENIVAPEGQAVKAIVNGQLIIIRDGVKYNVQGQKL
ncbi:MAG: InlB B-repeat-containing protein [Paludibacteraceae bacterium]|nr:InlB B-repeat-containing protein [Paludibacteraceae bacterium]